MAINSNGLVALSEMKDYLNITDASEDTDVERVINGVSDFFEEETNRVFLETTYTNDVLDPTGIRELLLSQTVTGELRALPITVFTSISISGTAVATTDFQVNTKAGIVTMLNGVWWGLPGDILTTYTGGYILQGVSPTPPQRALPNNIKQAAKEFIALKYRVQTKQLGPGIENVSAAGESVSYSDRGIPKSVMDVIRQYRIAA